MKELTQEQLEQVKAEHPSWFEPNIEVGKWYNLNHGKCLLFITKLNDNKIATGYGIDYDGNWRQDGEQWGLDGAKPASNTEILYALLDEAKKRGFHKHEFVAELDESRGKRRKAIDVGSWFYSQNNNSLHVCTDKKEWELGCSNPAIFKDGQWASVIPQEKSTLQDDIQALKDRWPDINFTIIAEGKK